jgi:dTMP kinase
MHLNQHRQPLSFSSCCGIEFPREISAIHAVDAVEKMRCAPGLVSLQVPDEMPNDACADDIGQLRLLGIPFLHAVFAEVTHADVVSRADGLRWKSLGHGYERHIVDASTRPLRRASHALAYPREVRLDHRILFVHGRDSSMNKNPALTAASISCAKLAANAMPPRGKLIVLEGIDGSGKRTQLEALARELSARGIPSTEISFPHYEGFFGKLVARFLNGEFGDLAAVDPHFSALLYAGDRLESKPMLDAALASGKIILADRYVGSNLAHQGSRVTHEKRADFLIWLKQLEYQVYGLPAEDLVIYLRVPVAEAHRLIGEKSARDYTNLRRDLQESNFAHLESAAALYDELARQPNWVKIECMDADGGLRTPAAIHQDVLAAVEAQISSALGSKV